MLPYEIKIAAGRRTPILLSIPHCGTDFPPEIKDDYSPALATAPDDTDWFLDRLYDFAPALGITTISAVWSRWVIDLNRHPDRKPLYSDGRIITDLCPTTTFLGEPIYNDRRTEVDAGEVWRRRERYFDPYHEKIAELLVELQADFDHVLLWDCHSIRHVVPTIQADSFPELILGSADGESADTTIIDGALSCLSRGGYSLGHNHPFKGGYITRHYGNPRQHRHALQLEMSKRNYMDDMERDYHPERAKRVAELLYDTLDRLSKTLISLKD